MKKAGVNLSQKEKKIRCRNLVSTSFPRSWLKEFIDIWGKCNTKKPRKKQPPRNDDMHAQENPGYEVSGAKPENEIETKAGKL